MAQRNSGYERFDSDLYSTPDWVTDALFRSGERFDGVVWEPACGDGRMCQCIASQTSVDDVIGTDVNDYGSVWQQGQIDFVKNGLYERPPLARHIITNPPYSQAEKFIRTGLEVIAWTHGKLALLLSVDFDSAKTRRDLFAKPPFAGKVVLLDRIRWIEGSTGNPSSNHAWFVFDAQWPIDRPIIRYVSKDDMR